MPGNESANGHEFIDNAGMGYGYYINVQWCFGAAYMYHFVTCWCWQCVDFVCVGYIERRRERRKDERNLWPSKKSQTF